MQIHELKPIHSLKTKKRIGRGGKRGTYSGKGVKGQKSRAGAKIRPEWRDTVKSIPKKRGYRQKSMDERLGRKVAVVNLKKINESYQDNEIVSIDTLIEKGILNKKKGSQLTIKILGQGEINKKITVKDCLISNSAKEKIESKGGRIQASSKK